ncbi:Anaphase-promoting complex subunit 11 [Geodia barretti]|uniref:Anaphase-promoting complex subunit 11 n=1 Tax=Geodia barretti TaxID=519541 RepID=A0AA35XCF7_GEOBA|nr:Anaphase-promoting complex subunit 11 [Geodia barretti]
MATPDPATESTSSASSPPQFRVKFKKWWAVAVWKWITPNDETECGICRLPFEGCCPDCKFPGDDCALVSGQCRHSFHLHCIQKWLEAQQMQQQCPMCRQEWQFSE